MMEVKKGIVLNNLLPEGWGSVYINSGTTHYRNHNLQRVQFSDWDFVPLFHDNAYVPKHDWRSLSTKESNLLAGNSKRCHNTITIGDISPQLKELFEQLKITDLTSREAVMDRIKSNSTVVKGISEAMQQFLDPLSQGLPFNFNCIAANLPNLELVACDVSKLHPGFTIPERKYVGLHNDGTKSMKIHTMHKRGNRMTINLGKQSRIFYFINLTLLQAYTMLKRKLTPADENITIYNIAPLFFKAFPDYPVFKVIQKPYEFYIAPTDNCFHDGSTLGNSTLDINMVYFGSFTC
ncbi:hypothetical protein [Mucilaginibacter sp. KACC 22063]|uniref:hypothetical protein n=1 Tax=Mucilaginibacter sp. KACC 22063 TaxID=3025666 RepID=UPI0023658E09|nr:hypothetical protein [Mucilaginibacter sp. KACC 22063]WDF57306.1 hypothetical protein PQ461_09595 [Mucilaginibacter sp. KACC 22063]